MNLNNLNKLELIKLCVELMGLNKTNCRKIKKESLIKRLENKKRFKRKRSLKSRTRPRPKKLRKVRRRSAKTSSDLLKKSSRLLSKSSVALRKRRSHRKIKRIIAIKRGVTMYHLIIRLIKDFETIVAVVKHRGSGGIVNFKRIQTYKETVDLLQSLSEEPRFKDSKINTNTKKQFLEFLKEHMKNKPKAFGLIKQVLETNKMQLENKPPYGGIVIKKGIIQDRQIENEIRGFSQLSRLLGKGTGLGNVSVNELIRMNYDSIEKLKKEYDKNKFEKFRKGLKTPLIKFFEGTTREDKMPRKEATEWKKIISKMVTDISKKIKTPILHEIAGSYARGREIIGDIDYVITVDNDKDLYKMMLALTEKLQKVTKVGKKSVKFVRFDEKPKPKNPKKERYSTTIKLWFLGNDGKHTKVEIYSYSQPSDHFIFSLFARSGSVWQQKKVRFHASKEGFKLSQWGIDKKGTDNSVLETPIVKKRLGKKHFKTVDDIYKFLRYSE